MGIAEGFPDDLENLCYSVAIYELTTDSADADLLEKARRKAKGDQQKIETLYVSFRVPHLRRRMEHSARYAAQILSQDYSRWRREAENTFTENGTEWDRIQAQIRSHPEYGKVLIDTGRDTLRKGGVVVAIFLLIVAIGLLLGPKQQYLAIGSISMLVFALWWTIGLKPMIGKDER